MWRNPCEMGQNHFLAARPFTTDMNLSVEAIPLASNVTCADEEDLSASGVGWAGEGAPLALAICLLIKAAFMAYSISCTMEATSSASGLNMF